MMPPCLAATHWRRLRVRFVLTGPSTAELNAKFYDHPQCKYFRILSAWSANERPIFDAQHMCQTDVLTTLYIMINIKSLSCATRALKSNVPTLYTWTVACTFAQVYTAPFRIVFNIFKGNITKRLIV